MSQYLLLRNNKESGPFSAEQLIRMGLKAYDLVWENGRSAAWRYPSEVPALKAFAPVIEEQPFDRFFEKKEETITLAVKKEKPRIKIKADWKKVEAVERPLSADDSNRLNFTEPAFIQSAKKETLNENFANDQYSIINNQSSFFNRQTTDKEQQTRNEKPETKTRNEKQETIQTETPSWKDAWLDWEEEKKSASSFKKETPKKNVAEKKYDFIPAKKIIEAPKLETKFSQSLDDIKEKYVENILRSKEKKSFDLSGIFNKQVFVLVALIALVSWGMYVSFFMRDDSTPKDVASKPAATAVPQTVTIPKDVASNAPVITTANDNSSADNNNFANDNSQNDNAVSTNKNNLPQPEQQKNIVATSSKPKLVLKKASAIIPNKNLLAKQNIKPANKQVFGSNKNVLVKNSLPTKTNISTSQPAGHSQIVQQNNGQYTRTVARRNDNNITGASPLSTGGEESGVRSQTVATSSFPRASAPKRIEDYVAVSSSGSGYSGVQNVHLNVQNITDVPIDLAVIDIQYFDANNRFQKGETVYVNNIPANDNVEVKVPDSRSSARINYKVSLVSASQKTLYMVQ